MRRSSGTTDGDVGTTGKGGMRTAGDATSKVLVVDDDELYRMLLCEIIRRADGFEVAAEAGDGSEALAVLDEVTPDVVLLDLMMPVMDGFATLPQLRDALPDATIVVLTALDETEAAREGVLFGMDAFCEKRHAGDGLVELLERAGR